MTISHTLGLMPTSHNEMPFSCSCCSAPVSIFSAVYSRSNTLRRSRTTTLGFASSISGRILSAMRSALAKNTRPSGLSNSSPSKCSSSAWSVACGR
ncbi:hypothetical protein D3C72_2110110 [compost metagenome]